MKNLFILLFLLVSFNLFGQNTAVTEDGKKVVLLEDGTYKIVEDVLKKKLKEEDIKKGLTDLYKKDGKGFN